jgi:murein DD-endopeptidase MepM/ murein hydrolase activator NlpD
MPCSAPRSLRRHLSWRLLGAVALVIVLCRPAFAQDSIKDARQQRDAAVKSQATAAAQIDLLKAQDADVAGAVQQINAAVANQQAKVAAAQQALADADAEVKVRDGRLVEARQLLADAHAKLGSLLVEDYVGRSFDETDALLQARTMSEGIQRAMLLDVISTDKRRLTTSLRGLENDVAAEAAGAQAAAQRAGATRATLAAELDALQQRLVDQQRLRAELERRLAEWRKKQDQLERESAQLTDFIRKEQTKVLGATGTPASSVQGFVMPAKGPFGSGFGMRKHPIFGDLRMHTGVDIDAKSGDPIVAAKEGKVIFGGTLGGYGNCVIIQHSATVSTVYGHMLSMDVTLGNYVGKGELIGRVGSTGVSTGPHLHFEVRINGEPKDPLLFLP